MHLLHELVENAESSANKECKLNLNPNPSPRAPRHHRRANHAQTLLAAGIEPDFVTSLDYNTVSTRFFENLEESGSTGHVHLVAEAKANWNVLDVFGVGAGGGGGTMSLLHNDFAAKLLRDPSRLARA